MNQEQLQVVMLVKALEEADRKFKVISNEEREDATRKALLAGGLPVEGPVPEVGSDKLSQAILDRARVILKGVSARYPALDDLLALGNWRKWIAATLLAFAVISGYAMSTLPQRINILDWAYFLLIAWNLLIYVIILAAALLPLQTDQPGLSRLMRVAARWGEDRVVRVLARTARSELLVDVGRGFFEDWRIAASPVAAQRVRVLLHVAAALVAGGLIVGLYLNFWRQHHVLHWESSLLNDEGVRRYVGFLFSKPASALGISIPLSVPAYEGAIGPQDAGPNDSIKPWLNLFSVILTATVIMPRLALAGLAWFKSGWLQRSSHLPDNIVTYARAVLGVQSSAPQATFWVFPYGVAPVRDVDVRANAFVRERFGRGTQITVSRVIKVGEEHEIENSAKPPADKAGGWLVLMSLSDRISDKTHGVMVKALRECASAIAGEIPVQLVIDEATYRRRFLPASWKAWLLDRRRRRWRKFASKHKIAIGFLPPAAD